MPRQLRFWHATILLAPVWSVSPTCPRPNNTRWSPTIAAIAGNEGARILDTLAARADSMQADALAATKALAGARSTTMVLPIALLAGGFLILLIFPDFYRVFG